MAIVGNPNAPLTGGDDSGPGGAPTQWVDTNTGHIFENVTTGDSEWGLHTSMQDTGLPSGLSGGVLKMLGAGFKPYPGISNVYISKDGNSFYLDPAVAGTGPYKGVSGGADASGGVPIGSGVAVSNAIVNNAINYRNANYTGSTTPGSFWDGPGPVMLAGLMAGGVLSPAFAGAGVGAEAAGSSALDAVYGVGSGGFGAPLTAYEAALPISAGVDAAAAGGIGSLTGTAGATALADAAALGTSGAATTIASEAALPSLTSITQTISNYLPSLSDLAKKAALNAGSQYLRTGKIDVGQIVTSLAAGAAGSVAGGVAGSAFDDKLLSAIASGAARGVTTAGLSGGDIEQAALMGAATSGAGYLAQGTSIPTSAVNALITSAVTGKPLAETLVNAGLNVAANAGLDAVKDTFTQKPADVETRDINAATTPTTVENPVSGLDVVTSSDSTSNEIAPVVAGTSDVAPETTGNTYTQAPATKFYNSLDAAKLALDNPNLDVSDGQIFDDSLNIVGLIIPETPPSGGIPADPASPAGQTSGGLPDMSDYTYAGVSSGGRGVYASPTGQYVDAAGSPSDPPTQTTSPDTGGTGSTGAQPTTTPTPDNTVATSNPTMPYAPPIPVSQPPVGTPSGGNLPTTTAASSGPAMSSNLPTSSTSDTANYPSPIKPYLQPSWLTTGSPMQPTMWEGLDPKLVNILSRGMAHGGQVHPQLQRVLADRGYGVNPVEMIAGPEDRYYARHAKRGFAVTGEGTGQSDDIPTMLADGEYVFDADTVSAIGDGSSKAGAAALDKMREEIRKHKRSASIDKIPPKAKSPLDYLKTAHKGNKHG